MENERDQESGSWIGERRMIVRRTLVEVLLLLAAVLQEVKLTRRAEWDRAPADGTYAAHRLLRATDREMDGATAAMGPGYLTRHPEELSPTMPDPYTSGQKKTSMWTEPSQQTQHASARAVQKSTNSTRERTGSASSPNSTARQASHTSTTRQRRTSRPRISSLRTNLPKLKLKKQSMDLQAVNGLVSTIGKIILPLTIGKLTKKENLHVVEAPLPFGILSMNTLHNFKIAIDFNQGTMFQLGAPLSTPTYNFNHVPNECTYWECQAVSQRTHHAHKPSAHGTQCAHPLVKTQSPTCQSSHAHAQHNFLTKANCLFYMPSIHKATTASNHNDKAQNVSPQQDNFHTKHTRDHPSPHNRHARVHRNKRDTRTKRRQRHHANTCTTTTNTTRPSTRNIETIHTIQQPHNRKTLRSFLSAVNAYKKFIPDYARLRTPLVNLLKKDVMWVWDDECQKAFTSLKESLTTHPTLHLYQEGLPCQVYCNASTLGIEGVLKQWLKKIKNPSGRLSRWRLRLSRYEYEVRYINGVQQYETDVITRNPFCGFLDASLIKNHQPSPSGNSSLTIDHNGLHTVSRKATGSSLPYRQCNFRISKSYMGDTGRKLSREQLGHPKTTMWSSSTSLHLGRPLKVFTKYRQSWSRQSGKLGNVHTKNEDTVALRKFREQIKVELGAKDGDRRVPTGLHESTIQLKTILKSSYKDSMLRANETSEHKKVVILLSLLVSGLLKLGNDLFFPEKMEAQTYELIVKKIRQHLEPKKKIIPQRNDATERFVAGLTSESLQKRLLQEDYEVKLERVFALAVSYELAEKDAKELHERKVARVTSHIERNRKSKYSPTKKNFTSSTKERTCYRSGMKNSHLAPACPHKSKACYKCKKIEHLSKICKAAKDALKNRYVKEQILSLKGGTEAKVTLTLDGNVLKCVVDTGSPVTLMPKTIFKKFWKVKLFPTSKNLKTLCNNPIKLVGERDVFVEEAGKKLRLIVVDEGFPEVELAEAKGVVNMNTTKGLFAYKRLPYGVAVAPNKFQRLMDNIFADIPGVACYIDDILVSGRDANEHKAKLELVFKRLEDKGLKLNKNKCRFAVDSVEYLGFRIDKNGLHPLINKIQAVSNAPEPKNIGQLRSFIGMLIYYARFIENISHILTPFYKLLKKNTHWKWTREHRILFNRCKSLLTNESVLAHYDPTKELVLACDASSYGLGVVLSHRDKNKQESPIAFASRTLTDAEKNYSQLEKEALSIVYGCEKFRQYLLGRSFVLVTDNRPLMHLFSPHKPIPLCAASRIKRWSLKLGAFHYSVEFRKTDDHVNADALSRLPLKAVERESIDEYQVLLLRKMNEVPFSFRDVAFETRRDKILSIVLRNVQEDNWQWREGIVIPPKLRTQILRDLHEMHFGIVKMKIIARRYFWWPGIDGNIEDMPRECTICQESANMPPPTISEWTWPEKPWHRLHMDLAGPFMGRMFLVIVDAYTKWLKIFILKEITSRTIIYHLRQVFARFGLPELLVTDNGRQFVSKELEEFTKMNGIRHTKTSPYNPSTNGLAERYVRYIGSDVYFRNYAAGPKWKQGTILKLLSCRHYLIGYEDQSFKRHINQLRPIKEKPEVAVLKDPRLVLPSTSTETLENHPEMKPSQIGLEIPERKLPEMELAEKPKSTGPDLAPVEDNQSPVAVSGEKVPSRSPRPQREKPRSTRQDLAPVGDNQSPVAASGGKGPSRSPRHQRTRRPPDRLHYY
ncbi:K02A2.6-like [Cordylochernes scorpioides]|uniref:RNA-directed DNA polymerase n=1 Tax=Cordylochernes scorpioides TaxID=51811 RepID=A0ABY6KZ17_9ARAC|nr:K02A2.6-like [Cordylochernes scorpioides]